MVALLVEHSYTERSVFGSGAAPFFLTRVVLGVVDLFAFPLHLDTRVRGEKMGERREERGGRRGEERGGRRGKERKREEGGKEKRERGGNRGEEREEGKRGQGPEGIILRGSKRAHWTRVIFRGQRNVAYFAYVTYS